MANRGETALLEVVKAGHTDVVKLLMEHSASVSTTERFGEAPLFVVAAADHDIAVNVLIKSGASVTDTESRWVVRLSSLLQKQAVWLQWKC